MNNQIHLHFYLQQHEISGHQRTNFTEITKTAD